MLTDTGKQILVHIREVLKGIEKVEQVAKQLEKGLELGTIHIGTFSTASAYFMPKLISAFKQKYPKLELVPHEGTVNEVKEWLHTRMIDVGILLYPTEEMEYIHLKKDKMAVVLRDDHPLASHSAITLKDLDHEPMIVCDGGYESPFVDMFRQAGATPHPAFTVYNINTSISMIREGMGLAILSEMSMSGMPPPEHVVTRELDPQVYRDVRLAVPSLKEASLAAKLFIEMAKELFVAE